MYKNNIRNILNCISPDLRKHLEKCSDLLWRRAEEIRLSVSKPAMICFNGGFEYVHTSEGVFVCGKKTIEDTLMLISGNSMYAVTDKLTKGFITIKGGNRVGIAGTSVITDGKITTIKEISSINIRIKRELKGVADKVISSIVERDIIHNTLIISPPQCGKTTLLRDIARCLGDGCERLPAVKVVVIDERSEVAAMYHGVAQNDIGLRTTVLDNCPKSLGIPLAVRSMSPDVIITDELDAGDDISAINYAANSGVKIISSVHSGDVEELINKNNFKSILPYFDVFITLTNIGGTGSIKSIRQCDDIAF